jgi:cAMP phosphodiesterase
VASKPQTINVWRVAAPKIPDKLCTIFIECSWPSGRPNELLYGHLSPEHLLDELVALAAEVVKFRRGEQTALSSRPVRKKHKRNPVSDDELRGALDGVRVYVIHCKDDMTRDFNKPMRDIIVPQVRALVEGKGLGAQILAAEQGMRIGASLFFSRNFPALLNS